MPCWGWKMVGRLIKSEKCFVRKRKKTLCFIKFVVSFIISEKKDFDSQNSFFRRISTIFVGQPAGASAAAVAIVR
jgi:hypothetical protein